jgi:hypothetical protein
MNLWNQISHVFPNYLGRAGRGYTFQLQTGEIRRKRLQELWLTGTKEVSILALWSCGEIAVFKVTFSIP